ncbi:MAG: phenylalanine--tRNA ligase subunit beta, partial [Desulfovibrio sp.]|nr:phenylalanine--tRNA ligase subunit beta [Desulfovibrio sp.]
ILLECGQPLHAFDFDCLSGRKIVVRRASLNEKMTTLDGQERVLQERDLCICDAEKPVALAGVMGGLNSEITDNTKNVFLESAVFHPGTIRKTSRRLGLSSEASYRFERGIDQKRTVWALDRACAYLRELGGGVVAQALSLNEAKAFVPAKISYHPTSADDLLGIELGSDFAWQVLTGLGCQVKKEQESWEVEQPAWRPDLTREADLIEEVGRVYGLDNIPPRLPKLFSSLEQTAMPLTDFAFWRTIRHWGAGLGLQEVVNYSFVGHKDLDLLGLPKDERISILNPLTAEQDVLRTKLAPGLLANVRTNLSQGAQGLKLMELAHIFKSSASSETGALEGGVLGLLLTGQATAEAWPHVLRDFDYMDLRGLIEHLLASLNLGAPDFVRLDAHPYLLPALTIELGGERLGELGRLKPKLSDVYLATRDIWLAELDLDRLKELASHASVHFTNLPVFPPIRRDITVIGDGKLSVGQVLEHIKSLHLPLLEDISFISLFAPAGEKHLSFRLTFRHPERTLKDGEVDKERNKVAQSLVKALGVRI